MTGDTIAELRAVSAGYGAQPILTGVTMRIEPAQLWFWLGPNGSGKSTLAKTLLGMLHPLGGELRRALPLERIGYVPQRCDWNPALPTTAAEFVELGLCGLRVPRSERPHRITGALKAIGMGGSENRDYWKLSGGQRQRLLLARALVRGPQLLVLDEPTTGLDTDSEHAFLSLVDQRFAQERTSVVFITHRHELARAHATHVATFGSGHVTIEAAA